MQDTESPIITNKFSLLEKMETEKQPQQLNHGSQRNKPLNDSDPELNCEELNNSVELPRDESQLELTTLIVDKLPTHHHLFSRNIP